MAEYWHQGFATEMAQAILNIAFKQLALADVIAFTLTTNLASRRVMEKVGFHFEREFVHEDQPHVLYRLHDSVTQTKT